MNTKDQKMSFRQPLFCRILKVLLLMAFVLASSASPVRANAEVDFQNYTIELNNLNVGIYCDVNGYGEIVILNGTVHGLFYSVENANGGILYRSKINGMNVTGVGKTTEATYQVTMIGMGTSTLSDQQGYISVNVMNLIGNGTNSKAVLNMVFRVNVDADGNESVVVDHYNADCR
jgi:hypothetical protein